METENKNSLLLKDFTRFCEDNPDLRFWQALQQWSGHNFILTADSIDNHTGQYMNTKDTYYWSMVTN